MSSIKEIIMNLDKNINELGTAIVNIDNNPEMKKVFLSYAEVITSIEELKIEFDLELRNQKEEWIRFLKDTKNRADEVYKKEVWYQLYYYIRDRS